MEIFFQFHASRYYSWLHSLVILQRSDHIFISVFRFKILFFVQIQTLYYNGETFLLVFHFKIPFLALLKDYVTTKRLWKHFYYFSLEDAAFGPTYIYYYGETIETF